MGEAREPKFLNLYKYSDIQPKKTNIPIVSLTATVPYITECWGIVPSPDPSKDYSNIYTFQERNKNKAKNLKLLNKIDSESQDTLENKSFQYDSSVVETESISMTPVKTHIATSSSMNACMNTNCSNKPEGVLQWQRIKKFPCAAGARMLRKFLGPELLRLSVIFENKSCKISPWCITKNGVANLGLAFSYTCLTKSNCSKSNFIATHQSKKKLDCQDDELDKYNSKKNYLSDKQFFLDSSSSHNLFHNELVESTKKNESVISYFDKSIWNTIEVKMSLEGRFGHMPIEVLGKTTVSLTTKPGLNRRCIRIPRNPNSAIGAGAQSYEVYIDMMIVHGLDEPRKSRMYDTTSCTRLSRMSNSGYHSPGF